MNASERTGPQAGPFVNLSQLYWNGLDAAAKGYEPMLKAATRWNLEVMALATRRVRAWAEMPGRISRCKTPVELAQEQLEFWQTAARDYSQGAQRLTAALGSVALRPGEKAPVRDYISVADTKPVAEEAPARERRAA